MNHELRINNLRKKLQPKIYGLKLNLGFTLVELLAVMIVMVGVATIIGAIISSSLRGSNKTNTVNNVRQNGNYAISQMSKMIEYARSFDGVSSDGFNYNTNCIQATPPSPTPTPAPVNYNYIKITSFDNSQIVFSCSLSPLTIASNSASIIDQNSISVTACSFTCSQERITDLPTIRISFTLAQKTTSNLVENKSSIPFETSVKMRNLSR